MDVGKEIEMELGRDIEIEVEREIVVLVTLPLEDVADVLLDKEVVDVVAKVLVPEVELVFDVDVELVADVLLVPNVLTEIVVGVEVEPPGLAGVTDVMTVWLELCVAASDIVDVSESVLVTESVVALTESEVDADVPDDIPAAVESERAGLLVWGSDVDGLATSELLSETARLRPRPALYTPVGTNCGSVTDASGRNFAGRARPCTNGAMCVPRRKRENTADQRRVERDTGFLRHERVPPLLRDDFWGGEC
ncbi:hypothetical protein BD311DRAFT_760542 [Dichomitus squalens]|uniref:Uncharacterized protein n=1 Tax=Dichomitus squalens TaxID=114155 RepID=A0A4Q9MIW4_9APHY|nr:hypothetical protein BD311DRAFT_760542 [Dichomitus squalens]